MKCISDLNCMCVCVCDTSRKGFIKKVDEPFNLQMVSNHEICVAILILALFPKWWEFRAWDNPETKLASFHHFNKFGIWGTTNLLEMHNPGTLLSTINYLSTMLHGVLLFQSFATNVIAVTSHCSARKNKWSSLEMVCHCSWRLAAFLYFHNAGTS